MAQMIRDEVGPLRRPDGRIDASAVAREVTLREQEGLPSWIAELDAPKDGLDHIEDQNMPQDQTRDPGDTMPAQGWAEPPRGLVPERYRGRYTGPVLGGIALQAIGDGILAAVKAERDALAAEVYPDAGRFPAPREDNTMAPVEIGTAQVRQDFGHAAARAGEIDTLTEKLGTEQLQEELETRTVRDLREMHHQALGVADWHERSAKEARQLSRTVGRLLRSVGDEIDPEEKAESMGTLR